MHSPNRFGAVEKCHGHFSLGAGEEGRFASFDALGKGRGRRHLCKACAIVFCGQTSPHTRTQVCLPISRQHPFARCQAANRNACGIHRGRNPLPAKRTAGISRRAAKTGFFPQKALLPRLCARGKRNCPSAISTPRLGVSNNPPAGRPRTFAPDRSALFMGHSVQALSAPARPVDAGNVIGQLAAPAQSRRPESAGLRACTGLQLSAEGAACRTR